MKQILFLSRYKFAYLLLACTFVLFISCNDEEEDSFNVNRVSMKTLPKVNYILGNTLDLSDMVITLDRGNTSVDIPFSSFASEEITTEPENGKVLELTDQSVTVKLGTSGKGLVQTINVTNNVIELKIKTPPTNSYVDGQRLDLTAMVLTFSYENGDERDFTFSDFENEISTFPKHGTSLSRNDNKEVTITHLDSKLTIQQELSIDRFIPIRSELISGPTKSEYSVGDILDLTGTIVKYTLFNRTTIEIPFEDFDLYQITTNPANRAELAANNTQVRVAHRLGFVVRVPLTIN